MVGEQKSISFTEEDRNMLRDICSYPYGAKKYFRDFVVIACAVVTGSFFYNLAVGTTDFQEKQHRAAYQRVLESDYESALYRVRDLADTDHRDGTSDAEWREVLHVIGKDPKEFTRPTDLTLGDLREYEQLRALDYEPE